MTEKSQTEFRLGDKMVDAAKGLPLTLGNIRRAKKEFGVGLEMFSKGNMTEDSIFALAVVVFQNADPTLTEEDVGKLPLPELQRFSQLVAASMEVTKADPPTAQSSTSSPPNTDGGQPT